MGEDLKACLDAMEARITEQVRNVETGLTRKIELVETGLTKKIELVETGLTRKIELVETGLTEKMESLESRLRADLTGRIDRAAEATATDFSHLHSEIVAVLDRVKKSDVHVTTCLETMARQSRWHAETDARAVELLIRVNALERRLPDPEGGAGGRTAG